MSNHIHIKQLDLIIHMCPNLNAISVTLPLKLWYWQVIKSHRKHGCDYLSMPKCRVIYACTKVPWPHSHCFCSYIIISHFSWGNMYIPLSFYWMGPHCQWAVNIRIMPVISGIDSADWYSFEPRVNDYLCYLMVILQGHELKLLVCARYTATLSPSSKH